MMRALKIVNRTTADVAVIGAGTAGVFAAIAAAKSGAKTVLVEKNSSLGGTVTTAGVSFPGLFFAWGRQIISGPCWEAIQRAAALGGAKIPRIQFRPQRHWQEQIRLNRFIYTAVLWEMLKENGVTVLTNAMLSAVTETEEKAVLQVAAKEGLWEIEARAAVDATGDANLVQMAGYPVEKSRPQQPATLQNHISGYHLADVDFAMLENQFSGAGFAEHITAADLIRYLKDHRIDVHIASTDADTSAGKTQLEYDASRTVLAIYTFYRSIKGLENLTVDFAAGETGVRESNRIVGAQTITAADYISGRHYSDAVCYAFYPIDRHVMSGIEQRFFAENVVGEIPYGALIPQNARKILCAGRCIASDSEANSALRVQAVCMASGQAAGCAAAISAQENMPVKDVPYDRLCGCLNEMGAIVPAG